MKSKLCLLILVCIFKFGYGQRYQKDDHQFTYRVNGKIFVKKLERSKDDKKVEIGDTVFIADNIHFLKVGTLTKSVGDGDETVEYYLLDPINLHQYIPITDAELNVLTESLKKKDKELRVVGKKCEECTAFLNEKKTHVEWFPEKGYVTPKNLEDTFVIEASKFQKALDDEFVLKRYYVWFGNKFQGAKWTYGAQLSVPFKLRPSILDEPLRITPELAIGGFVGWKIRIKQYRPVYWYPIIGSVGVSAIGINSDNTIQEGGVSDEVDKDALIFALNASVGMVWELENFQMGFLIGWDKPAGELGQSWIYNGRPWYSIAIGFNFLDFKKKED